MSKVEIVMETRMELKKYIRQTLISLLMLTIALVIHLTNEKLDEGIYGRFDNTSFNSYDIETICVEDNRIKETVSSFTDFYNSIKDITKPVLFNSNDLRVLSNVTGEEIDKVLEGTNLHGIGEACEYIEKEYNINALFTMSLAIHESGFGTNSISKYKNNVTSYRAYNKNTFSNAKTFNSKSSCIIYTLKKVKSNYLTEGGKYHYGYGVKDINVRYAIHNNGQTNYGWSRGINSISNKYKKKILEMRANKIEREFKHLKSSINIEKHYSYNDIINIIDNANNLNIDNLDLTFINNITNDNHLVRLYK